MYTLVATVQFEWDNGDCCTKTFTVSAVDYDSAARVIQEMADAYATHNGCTYVSIDIQHKR